MSKSIKEVGKLVSIRDKIGKTLFKCRSGIFIPLIFILLVWGMPSPLSIVSGCLFIMAGEVIRIWAVGCIKVGSSPRSKKINAERLISTGPFSYTRNPLYQGNLLIWIGFCEMSGSYWFFPVLLILFFFQYIIVVGIEEDFLREKFSEEYNNYCRRVPRWGMTFKPYRPFTEEESGFDLKKALKSEKRTFQGVMGGLLLMCGKYFLLK